MTPRGTGIYLRVADVGQATQMSVREGRIVRRIVHVRHPVRLQCLAGFGELAEHLAQIFALLAGNLGSLV